MELHVSILEIIPNAWCDICTTTTMHMKEHLFLYSVNSFNTYIVQAGDDDL